MITSRPIHTPKRDTERLADALRSARALHRMTQRDVCQAVGISKRTLINYEQGRIAPQVPKLFALARLLRISLDDLLFDKPNVSTLVR